MIRQQRCGVTLGDVNTLTEATPITESSHFSHRISKKSPLSGRASLLDPRSFSQLVSNESWIVSIACTHPWSPVVGLTKVRFSVRKFSHSFRAPSQHWVPAIKTHLLNISAFVYSRVSNSRSSPTQSAPIVSAAQYLPRRPISAVLRELLVVISGLWARDSWDSPLSRSMVGAFASDSALPLRSCQILPIRNNLVQVISQREGGIIESWDPVSWHWRFSLHSPHAVSVRESFREEKAALKLYCL